MEEFFQTTSEPYKQNIFYFIDRSQQYEFRRQREQCLPSVSENSRSTSVLNECGRRNQWDCGVLDEKPHERAA